jgi:hypothetical protein
MIKTLAFVAVSTTLAGCPSKALYFGTYTRVGIDVSQDSGGAGIGVKNIALSIAPPKKDGTAFDVLGTSDIDLGITDLAMSEIVAIGPAALCAAGASDRATLAAAAVAPNAKSHGPLIFSAATSWSLLDLSWGDATGAGLTFGYKRTVGIRMPIVSDTVGAAFAKVTINTTSTTHGEAEKSEIGGTRSKFVFSTGQAAVIKAGQKATEVNGGTATVGCS